MKKWIIFSLFLLTGMSLQAQNAKYVKAMQGQIEKMNAAKSFDEYQSAANGFERIAMAEKEEWLPLYYHAYCHILMANYRMQTKPEDIDGLLDKAQTSLDQIRKMSSNNSEAFALQAYVYQARIWAAPQSRGAEYTPLCYEACAKAMAMDPNNPRPSLIQGQHTFYTPAFWGGGPEAALPFLQKAAGQYASFQAKDELHPNWGASQNQSLLDKAIAATDKSSEGAAAEGAEKAKQN
ncbi:MAG: hypothetical protein AAFV25_02030 [Bacteroidota bacterium]